MTYGHNDPQRPRNIKKRTRKAMRQDRKAQQEALLEKKDKAESSADATENDKVFHADTVKAVKERIARLKKKIKLPQSIIPEGVSFVAPCVVINRDGVTREILPDTAPQHKILLTRRAAKVITSRLAVFAKVTQHEEIRDGQRTWIDGSWTIAPAHPAMINGTTVQHLSRRFLWFLRRYPYAMSFDGRVQPAALFYDYDIDPCATRQKMWLRLEWMTVKGTDRRNSWFRILKNKP